MKNKLSLVILCMFFSTCDVLEEALVTPINIDKKSVNSREIFARFNKSGPISTSFSDAISEANYLHDFEPKESEYLPLDLQPKSSEGGFILKSGVYSMNAKSFCLRGYTHGPSRGDGHLYAPLKGKKAGFVEAIINRFGEKPQIHQKQIQVLLWAIIAGADMNQLGQQHAKTLNELFTLQERLEFEGKDWFNGVVDTKFNSVKNLTLKKLPPKLQKLTEADNNIRKMVRQNKSFQEIEKVAIIAGAAPREDMIREVSKGRWSYHSDGYFVRFFPNGYPQTRVDVYVPFEGDVSFDDRGNPVSVSNNSTRVQQVIFNSATMVACPANQSSQKIGVSCVPVSPSPIPKDNYAITFLAYPLFKEYIQNENTPEESEERSYSGHVFLAFSKNKVIEQVKGFSPILFNGIKEKVDGKTDQSYLLGYHEIKFCTNVSMTDYHVAKSIRKDDYFLGFNDCVSYADDVADAIGLKTPTLVIDPVDFSFPMSFVRYLERNNKNIDKSACPVIVKKLIAND